MPSESRLIFLGLNENLETFTLYCNVIDTIFYFSMPRLWLFLKTITYGFGVFN